MKRTALVAVPVVLAGLAGLGVMLANGGWHSGEADTVPSGPMAVHNADEAAAALAAASKRAQFDVDVPTWFPTSANNLSVVNALPESMGEDAYERYVMLAYSGRDSGLVYNGKDVQSRLEVLIWNNSNSKPSGELVSTDTSGFRVFREVVASTSDGAVVSSTYTALKAGHEIMLNFAGQQPSVGGVEHMLRSFRQVTTD